MEKNNHKNCPVIKDHAMFCCNECTKLGSAICKKFINFEINCLEEQPWRFPFGKNLIQDFLNCLREKLPEQTGFIELIKAEQVKRFSFHKGITFRQSLPSPGVLLTQNQICHIAHFDLSTQEIENNFTRHTEEFNQSLEKTALILKKEFSGKKIPKVVLRQNIASKESVPVVGDSAMLPCWISLWHLLSGMQMPPAIAATGAIDEDENIRRVDEIVLKVSSAVDAGYRYVFYPWEQTDELPEELKKNEKVWAVGNLEDVRQVLRLVSPGLQAKIALTQFLEGNRKLSAIKLKKQLDTYLTQFLSHPVENWVYEKFRALKRDPKLKSKRKILDMTSCFISFLQRKLIKTDCQILNLAYLESSLPTPAWLAILPFILFDLHIREDKTGQQLYAVNSLRFYNHDQSLTIAFRQFESVHNRNRTNYWSDEGFRRAHQHLIGLFCFDSIRALSETISIYNRTPFENDLQKKLLDIFERTSPLTFSKMGTSGVRNIHEYWDGIKKVISGIFSDFLPSKNRYLRHDQRLGSLCRIAFEAFQQKLDFFNTIQPHIESHLENPPGDKSILEKCPESKAFLSHENYLSENGLEKLESICKQIRPDSSIRSLRSHLTELINRQNQDKFANQSNPSRTLSGQIDGYFKNRGESTLVQLASEKISSGPNDALFFQPALHLARLMMETPFESENLLRWLENLARWISDHENIFSIQAIAQAVSYFAGKQLALLNIPIGFLNACEVRNKTLPLPMIIGWAEKNVDIDFSLARFLPQQGFLMDFAFLFFVNPSGFICKKVIQPFYESIVEERHKLEFQHLLHASRHSGRMNTDFELPTSTGWKDYKSLNTMRREMRKVFYLENFLKNPEGFLKLPLAQLDPEYIPFTAFYLISESRLSNSHPRLIQRLKKRILNATKNLYDAAIIRSLAILDCFVEKKKTKLANMICYSDLDLQNLILAEEALNILQGTRIKSRK